MEKEHKYIENPKTKGSGIFGCIPQMGRCPNACKDCFFQSGRSYLEPLEENLPNVPSPFLMAGRVIRVNDGHDSATLPIEVIRDLNKVFQHVFYNTAVPKDLGRYEAPVVLTLNPGEMTDTSFHKLDPIPPNLMFVRFRANAWNRDLLKEAVRYYTKLEVPVVITFMAYYYDSDKVELAKAHHYVFKTRTLNSYWVIGEEGEYIEDDFRDNPFVYTCGYKGTHPCKRCGNCLREYFATMERMRK